MSTFRPQWPHQRTRHTAVYQVTDRLHSGRTIRVFSDEIAFAVSGWLEELGVKSPLVDEFARAVRAGDWPAAHAFGDVLSVDVAVAA
jgi:hypothetical protein